jgi:arsenate reductase (glutaredoxin)
MINLASLFHRSFKIINMTTVVTILHNPRCRKSREALAILEEMGVNPEIRLYVQNPPDKLELSSILAKLGLKPEEIIRKGEVVFKEKYKGKSLSDDEWLHILVENPILIERPIVIMGEKAVVGRPAENVTELLSTKKD